MSTPARASTSTAPSPGAARPRAVGPELESRDYEARHLLVLEGLEAVRKRPAMYIGSTDTRGLMHCLWEIIDNSVDEALGGFGRKIDVTLRADGAISVADSGPGHPRRQGAAHGTVRGRGRLHQAARGRQVRRRLLQRDGRPARRRLVGGERAVRPARRRGRPGRRHLGHVVPPGRAGDVRRPGSDGGVHARRTAGQGGPGGQGPLRHPRHLLARPADLPGRRRAVADRPAEPRPADELPRARARIEVTDARGPEPTTELFRHEGGIGEFCEYLAPDAAVTEVVRLQGTGSFTETVPMLDDAGHMEPTDVDRELEVDVAVRWGTGYDTTVRSYVNIIATPKGGTHVVGFERGADPVGHQRADRRPGCSRPARRSSRTTCSRASPRS